MITKVEIKNINSIKQCAIDFMKSKYQYRNEMILNSEVVNPIAFYGTNGSGKSSFLTAFSQMISLLTNEPDKLYPFIPNYINNKNDNDKTISIEAAKGKSSIKVYFKLDNELFEYFIETSVKGFITSEKLIKNKEEIFVRLQKKYMFSKQEYDLNNRLFPTLRLLSIEKNDEVINKCYSFLSNIGFLDATKRFYQLKIGQQKSVNDIIVEQSKNIQKILFEYKEFPIYTVASKSDKLGNKDYYVLIKKDHKDNAPLCLPWSLMSEGMINQSVMLSAVLSLPENGVLIIDEIEDALHPLTILDFIKVVQKKKIQLIFSSHNTFLLQSLRPDQIIFANWKNGNSSYNKLADIYPNIREINNIEKMYLANLFEEGIKKDD